MLKKIVMFKIDNFTNNDDIRIVDTKGAFKVAEYIRDLSANPATAINAYFCNKMNVRKRQLVCEVGNVGITCQAGAMQWTAGNVYATTGIKGAGDLAKKMLRGNVTGESAIKPEYTGNGLLVLEPSYKHILLYDLSEWNGSVILDDGMFLACESGIKQKAVMRSNISSALAGGKGAVQSIFKWFGLFCS